MFLEPATPLTHQLSHFSSGTVEGLVWWEIRVCIAPLKMWSESTLWAMCISVHICVGLLSFNQSALFQKTLILLSLSMCEFCVCAGAYIYPCQHSENYMPLVNILYSTTNSHEYHLSQRISSSNGMERKLFSFSNKLPLLNTQIFTIRAFLYYACKVQLFHLPLLLYSSGRPWQNQCPEFRTLT